MGRPLAGVFAAAIVTVVLTACGGSSTKTTTKTVVAKAAQTTANTGTASQTPAATSTPRHVTKAQAGKVYLRDIAPANGSLTQLDAGFKAVKTYSDLQHLDVKPVISAFETTDNNLDELAQQYPAAATDIKALVTTVGPMIADLQQVSTIDATDETQWVQQVQRDAAAERTQANIVRSDLDLPQHTQ